MHQRRITPYTTKSGLQIGCRYDPPKFDNATAEELAIQQWLIPPGKEVVLPGQEKWYAATLFILAVTLLMLYWSAPT